MAASEYLERKFGFRTRTVTNPVTETVNVTATEVLQNNPDRVMWLAINLSANTGYIGFDPQVSDTRGILLSALGGNVNAVIDEDGDLVTEAVYAIAPGGAGTWYFREVDKR